MPKDKPQGTRDLVARLRATGGKGQSGPLKAEAADEIERLRVAISNQCDHLEVRAKGFSGTALRHAIFNGELMAEELRRHAERYRGALAQQGDIEHDG